jgi:hypothetical protein
MNMMRSAASALFLFLASIPLLPAQALLTGPNTLSFTATSGGANPASQSIAIRHTGDTPKSFSLSIGNISGGAWLSVSAAGGITPARINVNANIAGLPPGTYASSILISSPNTQNTTVDVSLTIVAASALQVAPAALSFIQQSGADASLQEQFISVSTSGSPSSFSVTSTTNNSGTWLAATASPTTTPGIVSVRITPTGLSPGVYNGTVSIAAPGLTTINVPVSLTVSVNPTLSAFPAAVSFSALRTGSAATQSVAINISSGVIAFSATPTSVGNWLIVTPSLSSAPSSIDISANPAGLGNGTYSGTVTITAAGSANSPLLIPVSFTVTDSPVISTATRGQSVSLVSSVSGPSDLLRDLPVITVNSTLNTTVSVSTTTFNGGAWLSAGSATGTAPGTVNSFVDGTGLAPGVYTGQIRIQGPGNALFVPVTLTITSGSATLSVDPTSVVFNYQKGQTLPSNQVLNITSNGASLAYQSSITAITPTNGNWLIGAVTSGNTPGTATIGLNSATVSALPNGQYTATIGFSGGAGTGAPLQSPPSVNVVLNVSDTALFNVAPTTLDFSMPLNGNFPAAKTLAVTATDGTPKAFTVTSFTSTGGNWLFVSPTAGNTPSNISVLAQPIGLGTGVYEGTINILVPSISPTPQTVRVRLTIQTNVSLAAAPTSLTFAQASAGAAPPSQTLSVTASSGSVNYLVSAAAATGNWLSATPAGGSTPGTITVTANGAGLAAGTYTGSVGIVSGDANNSPLQIPVTLTIGAPTLIAAPTAVALTANSGSTNVVTQVVALSGGNSTFNATATANNGGNTWLSVTPSGTVPGNLTINALPTGLAAGTYTGTIVVTSPGLAGSPLSIPVSFTIGATAPAGRQIIAQIADGDGWKTTITLVNLDVEPAPYTLRFFASDGAVLRLPFEGGVPGRLEVLEGIIPVGGSRTIITAGTDTLLSQGWAELTSGKLIGGQGVFRARVAGRIDQEAGVSATVPSSRFVLPFDNTQSFTSSMALANTNLDQARATTVTPRLEDGTALAGDSLNLPARGHNAFELAARFPSMAGRRGSATFTSTGADFAALGLRFNNTGSFTSLPSLEVPLTTPTAEVTKVISQVADGDGWKTIITLVNLDTVPAPFTLRFYRTDGLPLTMPLTGASAADTVEGTIAVGGTRIIETLGGQTSLVQAWAQLTTTRNISGLAVFRQRVTGRQDQEAAVSLTNTGSRFVLPFDNTGVFTTTMALVNASATLGSTVSVIIRDEAGAQIGADSISLGGRGYGAFSLPLRFPATVARRGTVEFSASTQITGLGLRFTQEGAFTSFPVMPKR